MTATPPPPSPELDRLLQRCVRPGGPAIRLGLERIRRLLERLDQPQRGLAALHVAGSNGKGSTVAFLEGILRATGGRVGCYTSPHLERFNERIRVAGQPIGDAALARCLERALAADGEGEATFFELATAAALLHFAHCSPDWVVLETGLGGRLDATNALTPRLSLITPIALEHTDWLGGDLATIAGEKAGILKPGIPAVADPGEEEARRVVVERAARVGTPLWLRGRDYDLTIEEGGEWRYRDGEGELPLPPPGLLGVHQYGNAALAVAGVRLLNRHGAQIPPEAMAAGVRGARWPGRLERFAPTPRRPREVWLDGAHNPAAAAALARAWQGLPPAPTTLLFAALRDKAVEGMVHHLAPLVERVWCVAVGGERARDPAATAHLWEGAGIPAKPCDDPARALLLALDGSPPGGRILVTGSLFLVGAVRPLL